jgi:hypothetical protein
VTDGTVPPSVPARRHRRLLPRLLLAATAGLASLELLLRVFDVQVPMHLVWRWHEQLGWTQVRNAAFDYDVEGHRVHMECNALGFRDVDHRIEKPPGMRRIVVVGDSFCEAAQVNLGETFWRLLPTDLQAQGGGPVEAINLGVGDWGQAQEWIALRELGFRYRPDLVICEVFPLNDIGNNGLELYGLDKSHNDLYRPYFVEGPGGALVETRRDPWLARLRSLSRVFLDVERGCLSVAWWLERGSENDKWDARAHAAGYPGLPPLLYTYVEDAEQPPAVRRAWRVTELLLTEMAAQCRARGVALVLLVVEWKEMLGGGAQRMTGQYRSPPLDPGYPERRLAALGERIGAVVVPTRELFERGGDLFISDGHCNARGHRVLADALFAAIDRHRLLAR